MAYRTSDLPTADFGQHPQDPSGPRQSSSSESTYQRPTNISNMAHGSSTHRPVDHYPQRPHQASLSGAFGTRQQSATTAPHLDSPFSSHSMIGSNPFTSAHGGPSRPAYPTFYTGSSQNNHISGEPTGDTHRQLQAPLHTIPPDRSPSPVRYVHAHSPALGDVSPSTQNLQAGQSQTPHGLGSRPSSSPPRMLHRPVDESIPNLSRSPPRYTTTPISQRGPVNGGLQRKFIDVVCEKFNLDKDANARDRKRLEEMYAMGQGLSKEDHATRMYTLGASLSGAKLLQVNNDIFTTMQAILQDVKLQLDTKFRMSMEQNANLRSTARLLLFNGSRTTFMGLAAEIERYVRSASEKEKYANILGNFARERVFSRSINSAATRARNDVRESIRDSVLGHKATSLEEALADMSTKFMNIPIGASPPRHFLPWVACLRRFAFDHVELLGIVEPEDTASMEQEDAQEAPSAISRESSTSSVPESPSPAPEGETARKRKRQTTITSRGRAGRPPKGQDYWSTFEGFLETRAGQYGKPWNTDNWKNYLTTVVQDDHAQFKAPTKTAAYTELPDMSALYAQYGAGLTSMADSVPMENGVDDVLASM